MRTECDAVVDLDDWNRAARPRGNHAQSLMAVMRQVGDFIAKAATDLRAARLTEFYARRAVGQGADDTRNARGLGGSGARRRQW